MTNQTTLKTLYPFLHGEKQNAGKMDAALAHSVATKAAESRDANAQFFEKNAVTLVAAAKALAGMWHKDGRLFTMGNGGSSCDAAHVAVEFLHPITAGRPALATIALTTDMAMISAVGNDVGFDQIFVRQIEAQGRAGDGLMGFSTSGNSTNLIAAFAAVRKRGLITFGFAGGDGGKMKTSGLIDHCLVVETSSVHRVQECHLNAYHILWDLVHTLLADTRGSAS